MQGRPYCHGQSSFPLAAPQLCWAGKEAILNTAGQAGAMMAARPDYMFQAPGTVETWEGQGGTASLAPFTHEAGESKTSDSSVTYT